MWLFFTFDTPTIFYGPLYPWNEHMQSRGGGGGGGGGGQDHVRKIKLFKAGLQIPSKNVLIVHKEKRS